MVRLFPFWSLLFGLVASWPGGGGGFDFGVQSTQPTSSGSCALPEPWRGSWYQNDHPQPLTIGAKSVSTKGTCQEARDNQFLFREQSKSADCWRCVIFFSEHKNVLQYKETSCMTQRSLAKACLQFNGDDPLITLFRADAQPEPCPIQAPANFTYSDIRGECQSRISTIDGCASNAQIKLHYQACPEVQNTESKEEELVCLGSWKQRRHRYFVAKLLNHPSLHEGESYRCFIYRRTSSGGRLGISADASCRELVDIDSAAVRIDFQQDNYPSYKCRFPHWLRHLSHNRLKPKYWESLNSDTKHTISVHDWVVSDMRTNENRSSAVCIQAENYGVMDKFVLYRIDGCLRGYQCVKVYKRTHQVVELIRGLMAPTEYQACTEEYITDDFMQFETLLLANGVEEACPKDTKGRYKIEGCEEENAFVSFGCTNQHQLIINQQCQVNQIETYNCHGHWTENNLHYLVLREQHTGKKICYVYAKRGQILSMSGFYRHPCKRGIMPGINGHRTFNVTSFDISSCDPSSARLNGASKLRLPFVTFLVALLTKSLTLWA